MEPVNGYVGRSLPRREDRPLLVGEGRFLDDLDLPRLLHMAVLRSPHAHARIVSVDTTRAAGRPGVHAVVTASEMHDLAGPVPMIWAPPGVEVRSPKHWPLKGDEVRFAGDAVAAVLADDPYTAIDALDLVDVAYEQLPVVLDPEAALEPDAPLVHADLGTNASYEWSIGGGDMEAALSAADVVVRRRIVNHRVAAAPMEPRGALASWASGKLTMWTSTQNPHLIRRELARMLGLREERVRVIAPDVGGAFGAKSSLYPEEALVAWCSRRFNRAVKWVETRIENLAAMTHARDQVSHATLAARKDGTLLGLHVQIVADLGAYHLLLSPMIPCLSGFLMSGCYRIPAVRTDVVGVFTTKTPTDAYRGAGRPEAAHVVEVMMDQLALELGIDRLDLRRRNFIPASAFPATTAQGIVYDSGDYEGSLDRLLEIVDVDEFERERHALRADGRYLGIGFSTWVDNSGIGPSRIVGPKGSGIQSGMWESSVVRMHPDGTATVFTGASPHGQGHETAFPQVVADRLGIAPDDVALIHSDTAIGPFGHGTYGSRTAAVGGEAALRAADVVAAKARQIVAHLAEANPEDIELRDGHAVVRGSSRRLMTIAEVATAAYIGDDLPEGMRPGLEETYFHDPPDFVYPFGAHAAVCEVDLGTGGVTLLRYVAVDDCGRVINPLLVTGQIHGGIAQGVAQALLEQIVFADDGQLATGTFMDYMLPTACDLPPLETDRTETPSPHNTLGVKGAGEAGTIGATPAVVNAVVDALAPLGVTFLNMPLSPAAVWSELRSAEGSAGLRSGGTSR
jgi:carbon-monoxide dehydrogenase large subunit